MNWPLNSLDIWSFNSIVKYEIHLLESSLYASYIASVGHASIHAVQLPQWSVTSLSYSSSRSNIISAKKKKDPTFFTY